LFQQQLKPARFQTFYYLHNIKLINAVVITTFITFGLYLNYLLNHSVGDGLFQSLLRSSSFEVYETFTRVQLYTAAL